MQRPLLQGSPFRKPLEQSPIQSRLKSNSSILSNLTQITIQTNDREVPFISIFKPDIRKEQRRVQGVTLICNNLKKWETLRTQYAINKLAGLKLGEKDRSVKVICLNKIVCKLERRRILSAFYQLVSSRNRKRGVFVAAKLLVHIQAILRNSSIRNTFNKMKINLLKSQISRLENEEQTAKEQKVLREDLFKLKQSCYDTDFIATIKTFMRLSNEALIDGLRQANYQGLIKVQIKRFEQLRFKMQPRRKQPFQNETILIVFGKLQRSFQSLLSNHINYEQQLKGQLEGYQNIQGIAQLNEIIRQKDSLISQLQSLTAEISRVDTDLKRFTGDKYNIDKITSILATHEKKLDIRLKKSEGIAPKIVQSRLFLMAIITFITKRSNEERDNLKKQVQTFVSICNISEEVTSFAQNKKQKGMLRPIAEAMARLYHQITELQLQVAFIKEREVQQQQSIQKLNKFIKQLQSKNYHSDPQQQSQAIKLAPQLQPILSSIVTLVKINNNLQQQNQSFHRQIQQFQNKYEMSDREHHSNVSCYTPQKFTPQPVPTIRPSEESLANRFFSPLKEIMLDHQQNEKLQGQLSKYEQSIHQVLQQNMYLQDKVVQLQTAQQMIEELQVRNRQLKGECEGFKGMQKDHLDLLFKVQSYQQQIVVLNKQNATKESNSNKLLESELKIKELSFVNNELQQKIQFLQQSTKNYNQIASSQTQLTEQMKQINKSSKAKPSSSQQLLMKQTQLMKQIINLKIQSETVTMNHIKQITGLKNELTSYQTIINKLEIDIIHKENQTQKLEEGNRVLQNKLSQVKQTNIELENKLQELEEYVNTDRTRKGYENSLELSKLQNQCSRMYEHLGESVDTIKAKQGQLDSLIALLKSRDDIISSLQQQKQRILLKLNHSQLNTEKAQESLSSLRVELSQLKNEYLKMQHQLHNYQQSKGQQNNYHALIHELQQKQNIINNLLEHNKNLSSTMTSQLFDAKSDYIRREKSIQQKLSQKELTINKLQFDLNQKHNTIRNLQSLLQLYSSQSNRYPRKDGQIQSRDKEILYLSEQVKSLQQFLNDLMTQYHQLQLKYQKQRSKIDPSQLSPLATSHKKYAYQERSSVDILQDYNQCLKKVQERKQPTTAKSHQTLNNTTNILQKQLSFHFKEFMASNQSLVYSQDNQKEQVRNILSKAANSTSTDWILGLVFNILINISKLRVESEEARKIWRDLLDLKARYSGEQLFVNLEAYCREFISLCVSQ